MAPAVLAAIPQITKVVSGINQLRKGKKIKVGERKVSEEMKKAARDKATRATSSKMSGQDRTEEKLAATSSNLLEKAKGASSANEYLAMASKQAGALQDKQLDIEAEARIDKERREGEATDAQVALGTEKTRIGEANIADQAAAKTALLESSGKNIQSGIKGLAGVGSAAISGGLENSAGEGSKTVETKTAGTETLATGDKKKDLLNFLNTPEGKKLVARMGKIKV